MNLNFIDFIKNSIDYLDDHEGSFTLLLTTVLIGITFYYSLKAKSLAKKSQQIIDENQNRSVEYDNKIRKNYVYIVNNELVMNTYYCAVLLFFIDDWNRQRHKKMGLGDYIFSKLPDSLKTNDQSKLTSFISEYIKDDTWFTLKSEFAKYFSSELMLELSGYYTGIVGLKAYSKDQMEIENISEVAKGQLIHSKKCLDLLELEISEKLRVPDEEFQINGTKFKVNYITGEIQ